MKAFSKKKKKNYECLPVDRVDTLIDGVIDVDVIAAVTTIIDAVCWLELDVAGLPTMSFVSGMVDCWLQIYILDEYVKMCALRHFPGEQVTIWSEYKPKLF